MVWRHNAASFSTGTPSLKKYLLALLLLTACAQPGPRAAQPADTATPTPATQGVTRQQLYQFLLGEIASQRGDLRLASESFMDLAKKTRDPRLARRAADWAMHQPERARTLKALRLWLEIEPSATTARERLLALLLLNQEMDAAQEAMRQWLQHGPADQVWLQLSAILTRPHAAPERLLEAVNTLAQAYAHLPEAAFAHGRVALAAGQPDTALKAAEAALSLRADWDNAVLLKGDALSRTDMKAALAWWRAALERQPQAVQVREALAQALRREGQLAEARAQYRRLLADSDGKTVAKSAARGEWLVLAGLLSEELNETAEAERYLREAIEAGARDADGVRIALGELAEKHGRLEDALKHYRSVTHRRQFEGQTRVIGVLGRLQRFDEGRLALQQMRPTNDAERLQRIQVEAALARAAGDFEAVFAALEAGLVQMPEHPDVLYDHAMAAEQLGRFTVMERDLRRLIALRPDSAHAYNALAYTLTDRLGRAAEALPLLETALKLAPEDPYILDSMGWALLKAGKVEDAVGYLQRAYKAMPDAEVALHLGEALWQRGERDAARAIWQAGLDHPSAQTAKAARSSLADRLKW